jgi:plasmid stabilization system protein ParE
LRDFERIADFLLEEGAVAAGGIAAKIIDGISVLERHPRIGRPADHGLYELVISYGKSGYVALYRHIDGSDIVLVLALRNQREAGYP